MNKKRKIGRTLSYYSILAILCIIAFLFAKYMVRNSIDWEETPIDTSERL